MELSRKVVWAEGILLGQQHFQCWDEYLQNQQQLYLSYVHPFVWGIAEIEFDENFLAQGVVRLNRCLGLLKNRQWIAYDHTMDGSLSINLPKDVHHRLGVFLSLPEAGHVEGIAGYPEVQESAAWKGVYQSVQDRYDPAREREVLFAKQSVQLSLDRPALNGLTTLQVAELEYNPQQSAYRFSRSFVPPLLKISGSVNLMSWLAKFIGTLTRHIQLLNEQKSKYRQVENQFGYGDFIFFNLVQTLTTYLPRLMMIQKSPELSPYPLYTTCCELMGALWGYLDDPLGEGVPPVYDPEGLSGVFLRIQVQLEALLSKVMPANTLDIQLQSMGLSEYQSEVLDHIALKEKQFCLAIYHETMTPDLVDKVLAQVKVSAPSELTEIVQSFTQGIELNYIASPGKDLLAKRNYHYFLLNKQSRGWEKVLIEKRISIFVSQALLSLPMELIAHD